MLNIGAKFLESWTCTFQEITASVRSELKNQQTCMITIPAHGGSNKSEGISVNIYTQVYTAFTTPRSQTTTTHLTEKNEPSSACFTDSGFGGAYGLSSSSSVPSNVNFSTVTFSNTSQIVSLAYHYVPQTTSARLRWVLLMLQH